MAKVIERSCRGTEDCKGKPTFWTEFSFVGGIDLGQITDYEYNRDHLFLRKEERENMVSVDTHYHAADREYITSLVAWRTAGTKRAIRAGTRRELGYIVSAGEAKYGLRTHKKVINMLKEAYFGQKKEKK